MNRLGSLLFMILSGLLIAPLVFTGNADQIPGFDSDGQEYSLLGNIKVRGTPSGHLTVAVDKEFLPGGIQADGVWDVAFHFAPKKSKTRYQNIALDIEGGIVSFTDRRLTVISAERYIMIDLSLEKETQSNNGIFSYDGLPETVRINRGAALGQYRGAIANGEGLWLCGTDGGACSVVKRTGDVTANNGDPLPETNCPSGERSRPLVVLTAGPARVVASPAGPVAMPAAIAPTVATAFR